jgi:long-chain acyl-CoA synthetase
MAGVDEFWERYGMAIDETDRTLCFLPLSHIFDRGSCQLAAILHGSTIAYADKPGTLLEDMQKYNPTWINCVPRLYEKIYIQFRQTMEESPLKKKIFDWALKVELRLWNIERMRRAVIICTHLLTLPQDCHLGCVKI